MKFVGVVAVLALLAGQILAEEDSKVVKLTKDNFDEIVNEAETILVKFFAPWCGHCKHLAPEYIKAAAVLEKDGEGVILAEVDATVESDLADRFKVTGYPTLYVFHKGEKTEYRGPRDSEGIVKYMRGQAGPAARPLADEEALTKFLARQGDVKFVAFTKPDTELAKVFLKHANANRDHFSFGIMDPTEKHKDEIVAFRDFGTEDKEVVYPGKADAEELRKWAAEVTVPLAGFYNDATRNRYGKLPILVLYGSFNAEHDPAGLRYALNRLRAVAKDFKGKLNFVAADKSERNFRELGFKDADKYSVAIENGKDLYKSDIKALNKADIKAFAESYLEGKVELYVKSEDVPAPAKEGEIVVVVGKTFDEIVTKTETDTFIVAYAPWCGHCKALLPTWEELAKKYNVNGGAVRVAKIDATANFLPSVFDVRGYPSIFWVPAGKGGAPVRYEGARDIKDFESYIKNHASESSKKLEYAEEAPAAEEKKDEEKKEL